MTRIGWLQAFESGPTVEEPCPAEMADYDRVYFDSVTGASLHSKLCETMQLEINYMKEMNVFTLCEHGAVKRAGTHSDWDTSGLHEQGRYTTSFHLGKIGCPEDEEYDECGFDGHVYDICRDPTC